jgi:2-amino-4-hydroxy-6-hydroxymethyldihydropteridine diphosphokinase
MMRDQHTAYIALGSNLGDREQYLLRAIRLLHQTANVKVIRFSSIYETQPVGVVDQPLFLNMVVEVSTTLNPNELLEVMMAIEQANGRLRLEKWGPRTLDLDLLLYDQLELNTAKLTIPHPRMWEREFVMVPLQEIMPRKIGEERNETPMNKEVRLWKTINWETVFALTVN